jgi:hypothetical protein
MLLEPRLGKLIRKLNPYTNGDMHTMLCGIDAPTDPATLTILNALGTGLVALGNALIAYAATPNAGTLNAVNAAEDQIDPDMPISDLNLRIDNDYRQDYMTWVFRGQPYAVKRALRINYRYQLPPPVPVPQTPTISPFPPTGIFATEHVLIGYAGGNG